jgi:hypothetical protein
VQNGRLVDSGFTIANESTRVTRLLEETSSTHRTFPVYYTGYPPRRGGRVEGVTKRRLLYMQCIYVCSPVSHHLSLQHPPAPLSERVALYHLEQTPAVNHWSNELTWKRSQRGSAIIYSSTTNRRHDPSTFTGLESYSQCTFIVCLQFVYCKPTKKGTRWFNRFLQDWLEAQKEHTERQFATVGIQTWNHQRIVQWHEMFIPAV